MRDTRSIALENIAASLDIAPNLAQIAVSRYTEVGEQLSRQDSKLNRYTPSVFPQGSFRLGTVIRPVDQDGEYDIDLVCLIQAEKQQFSQAELKSLIGDDLRASLNDGVQLIESRRCWRLEYQDGFHMDVLPALPNPETAPDGILITDTDLRLWQKSNPKQYAAWFRNRMGDQFNASRAHMAEVLKSDIATVPDWLVKTPLQRAVQLLKRHRDHYFRGNPDLAPISIVITTLSGQAYAGQSDLLATLLDITSSMHQHITRRNGTTWVENPVDRDENFADKWKQHPHRDASFHDWVARAHSDFAGFSSLGTSREGLSALASSLALSEDLLASVIAGSTTTSGLMAKSINILQSVPPLDSTDHEVPPPPAALIQNAAKISTSVYRAQGSVRPLRALGKTPVQKNKWLRFTVRTDAAHPYTIKWQVVNTGQDARNAHCLRGGIFDSEYGEAMRHWERTQYRGTHTVQAFVVKDGLCVAATDKVIVRIV